MEDGDTYLGGHRIGPSDPIFFSNLGKDSGEAPAVMLQIWCLNLKKTVPQKPLIPSDCFAIIPYGVHIMAPKIQDSEKFMNLNAIPVLGFRRIRNIYSF